MHLTDSWTSFKINLFVSTRFRTSLKRSAWSSCFLPFPFWELRVDSLFRIFVLNVFNSLCICLIWVSFCSTEPSVRSLSASSFCLACFSPSFCSLACSFSALRFWHSLSSFSRSSPVSRGLLDLNWIGQVDLILNRGIWQVFCILIFANINRFPSQIAPVALMLHPTISRRNSKEF